MKTTVAIITAFAAGVLGAPFRMILPNDAIDHVQDKLADDKLSTVEAVNYIFQLEQSSAGVTAYDDEFQAVKNPAEVLGKRDDEDLSTVEAVNYIFQLEQSSAGVTAYDDEFNAVKNPTDVLG